MTKLFKHQITNQKVSLILLSFLILITAFTTYALGASDDNGYWCYAITNQGKEVSSKTVYTKDPIKKIYFGVENFSNEDVEAYVGTYKNGQWSWKNVNVINNEISLLEAGFDFPAGTTGIKLKYISKQPSTRAGRIYLISVQANQENYKFKVFPRELDDISLYPTEITLQSLNDSKKLSKAQVSTATTKVTTKTPTSKPTPSKPTQLKPTSSKQTTNTKANSNAKK